MPGQNDVDSRTVIFGRYRRIEPGGNVPRQPQAQIPERPRAPGTLRITRNPTTGERVFERLGPTTIPPLEVEATVTNPLLDEDEDRGRRLREEYERYRDLQARTGAPLDEANESPLHDPLLQRSNRLRRWSDPLEGVGVAPIPQVEGLHVAFNGQKAVIRLSLTGSTLVTIVQSERGTYVSKILRIYPTDTSRNLVVQRINNSGYFQSHSHGLKVIYDHRNGHTKVREIQAREGT